MTGRYEEAYARSLRDPEGFWAEAAQDIDWYETWDQVLDASDPRFPRWFGVKSSLMLPRPAM